MVQVECGTEVVQAALVGRVLTISLNRPERRNALAGEMLEAMTLLLERAALDDEVGCVVLRAEGSAFSAGGDVRDGSRRRAAAGKQTYEERADQLVNDARVAVALHELPKVTIAAVQGAAVGAGFALALACDLRIASHSATFRSGWTGLALGPDFGGSWFLTRLVGPSRALEILVDNNELKASQALELGLVNQVVAAQQLDRVVMSRATSIGDGPMTAYRYCKAEVEVATKLGLRDAIRLEAHNSVRTSRTPEHGAAVTAWLEQRNHGRS